MKALANAFRKFSNYPDMDKRMIEKFSSKQDTLLTINEGTWYRGENKAIDNLIWSKMQQETVIDGFPSIVIVKKVIDAVPLPFTDVQGAMLTGYQEYLEGNWIKQLKSKYTVKIDIGVLEEIRKNLNNE